MKCFVCGSEMRLDQTAGEESDSVSGLEHRTFRCPSCGDVEQRLVFRAERDAHAVSAGTAVQSSAIESCSTDQQPAASAAVRQPLKKLSGIYTRLRRLLPFRREITVPARSAATMPATDQQSTGAVESVPPGPGTPPTSPHSAEREVGFIEADDKLDECEVLLKRAIEMVHAPAGSPEPAIETDLNCEPRIERAIEIASEPAAAAEIVVQPEIKPVVTKPEPPARKPVVVEIHYDAVKAKYAAKDSTTGLLVLRHEDRTRLKGMCERMGWQVLDRPAGA